MPSKNQNTKLLGYQKLREKLITIFACLVITLVFWIFNALSHDNSTLIYYPIKLDLDQKKYINHGSYTKNISVAVSGYGWTLLTRSLGVGNKPIILYPNKLKNNKICVQSAILPILKDRVSDIKVLQIIEDTLEFDIEKRKVKHVFLKLNTKKLSLPSQSSIIGKIKIEPNFIICNGSEKNIDLLPDSIFFSIPDQYIEKDFNDFVEINYRPSSDISLAYQSVKVSFSISK